MCVIWHVQVVVMVFGLGSGFESLVCVVGYYACVLLPLWLLCLPNRCVCMFREGFAVASLSTAVVVVALCFVCSGNGWPRTLMEWAFVCRHLVVASAVVLCTGCFALVCFHSCKSC